MAHNQTPLPVIGPEGSPRLDPVPGVEGNFNGVMAWRPELLASFFEFYAVLWTEGVLDMRIKDLARMKIARTVGCRLCQNTRFKVAEDATVEDDYLDIDDVENGDYTDAEKAALRYVETFCWGAANVTDEMVADLRALLLRGGDRRAVGVDRDDRRVRLDQRRAQRRAGLRGAPGVRLRGPEGLIVGGKPRPGDTSVVERMFDGATDTTIDTIGETG